MRSHSLYIHSIGSALAPTSHCSCACIHHDLCGTAQPVHCSTPVSVSGYGGTSKIPPRIQLSARGSPSPTARRVCRIDIFIEDWTVSVTSWWSLWHFSKYLWPRHLFRLARLSLLKTRVHCRAGGRLCMLVLLDVWVCDVAYPQRVLFEVLFLRSSCFNIFAISCKV